MTEKKLTEKYNEFFESIKLASKSVNRLENLAKRRLKSLNKEGVSDSNYIDYLKGIKNTCENMKKFIEDKNEKV